MTRIPEVAYTVTLTPTHIDIKCDGGWADQHLPRRENYTLEAQATRAASDFFDCPAADIPKLRRIVRDALLGEKT